MNRPATGMSQAVEDGPQRRIERARLRKRIAAEVIGICRRLGLSPRTADRRDQTVLALELHDAHVRHSRDLGQPDMAEQAEKRYDQALERRLKGH